jgi:hypothetical protein
MGGNFMKRFIYALGSLVMLTLLVAGCASLAEPNWAKLEVTSDIEQLTDGSMYTSGQTQIPEYVKGEARDDSRFTDANVSLKTPQDVKRIVIRRRAEDTVPVDLDIFAMVKEEWKLLKEVRGEEKSDIDVKINTVETDKIKIRAQRAARTATGKSAVTAQAKTGAKQGAGARRTGNDTAERMLREPLKFAEIEVYGLAATPVEQKK